MPSLIEIGSLVLGKKIISMYFHNFYIIFPWKRAESFLLEQIWMPFTQ